MENIKTFANQAEYVAHKVGGIKKLCEWTGEKYHVVYGWINRSATGYVPAEHYSKIIEKARESGIDLTERDLIFPQLTVDSFNSGDGNASQGQSAVEVK